MTLQKIAYILGGQVSCNQVLAPGPGHSARDRSLAIRPEHSAPDGILIYSHAGDDWRECRDYVLRRLGIVPGTNAIRTNIVSHRNVGTHDRISRARELWDEGSDPRNTLVEIYLSSRALVLPPELAGPVIRFHESCPWFDQCKGAVVYVPAMIAVMRSLYSNEITAIHRSALTPDGRKIERRMLGVARNAAIKLDDDADVSMGLIIGEGFETCLAARLAGFRPVWALGSAPALSAFPVLPGIEAITILGEVGDGGANDRAARTCAARWVGAGQEVFVVTPLVGKDLNDVWREVVR
jgi:putative DNA primase/helicase